MKKYIVSDVSGTKVKNGVMLEDYTSLSKAYPMSTFRAVLSRHVNYHFISAQKRLFFAHSFGISLSPFPKECAKFFVNYFGMGHG
ncbi:hypothetical protein ETC05_12395, partial [Geobacillus sp. BMUD]|uniref:hypothetical protein n=1 Tax=Geobacillus sp. BMUD TaxID=2508876 RepID=UPI0014910C45